MIILVTGGNGFLGKHVQEQFEKYDLPVGTQVLFPDSSRLNLLDEKNVKSYLELRHPDVILHMAAICGGIGLNARKPADLTHLNLKMLVNLFEGIRYHNIKNFYGIGSVCSYPKHCPTPFKEDDMWNGKSEETNRGYGESKKMMISEFQTHKEQYGLKGAVLVPVNMYGQKDHFDLQNSHVIPALIRKFDDALNAGQKIVECWGTGLATREFVYAGDAAEAIVHAVMSKLDTPLPINIGTGVDISIADLAAKIANLVGYTGEIVFNGAVSDGQPKRLLDVSRAKEMLGFEAKTSLDDGLKRTIEWYRNNKV